MILNTSAMTCASGSGVAVIGCAFAPTPFTNGGGLAFAGMREQGFGHVEQFAHAGAAARGDEADGHQVAFAQALLEGVVQFLALQPCLAEVQVMVHHRFVDLDHLVDDLLVPVGDRAEVAMAAGLGEAVDDALAAFGRQVERQHFVAEGVAQLVEQHAEPSTRVVDLVDHQHPAQVARLGMFHHPHGAVIDAVVGVDDDGARSRPRQARTASGPRKSG